MDLRGVIVVTAALLCLMLDVSSSIPPATCCTAYTKKPVPFRFLTGYRNQSNLEHCRIDAIIFYTVKGRQVCTSPNDKWVQRILELLSVQLREMSEIGSADSGNLKVKNGTGSLHGTSLASTEEPSTESPFSA